MNITWEVNGNELEVIPEGRLDTDSSPELASKVKELDPEITKVILNLEKILYISSAGLRVLIMTQKKMVERSGSMVIRHPNELVRQVLDETGFCNLLTIEE